MGQVLHGSAGILGAWFLGKRLREVPAVQWLKRWASPSCPVCHFVVMFAGWTFGRFA